MEKMEAHNKYLTILESDLAKIKETLIVDSKNAKEAQHIGQLKKEMAVRNQHVLEKQLRRIREYLSSLKQMTELSNDIKVSSGYAMTIANMCLSDESLVVTTVAQAASGIEEAMEKIAILSSDVASIRAKASSEDDNTKISIKADKAYKEGEEAAKISEEATMSSLLATIQAADVNARFVKQLVDSFSNAISDWRPTLRILLQQYKPMRKIRSPYLILLLQVLLQPLRN
jgi:hypothetical protein